MNPKTNLIGIMGPAGTGKDTMADHLVKNHNFVKMSLADEMKRICRRVYDFSEAQLWGPSSERNAPDRRYPRRVKQVDSLRSEEWYTDEFLSARIALQILGTEFGRTCYQNTWIDLTIRDAKKVMAGLASYLPTLGLWPNEIRRVQSGQSVVIPDCRFQNEVDAIKKAGGLMIRLKRKTSVDALGVGIKGHASEAEQLSIPDSEMDFVIEVEDGVPNFHKQIDVLLERIR